MLPLKGCFLSLFLVSRDHHTSSAGDIRNADSSADHAGLLHIAWPLKMGRCNRFLAHISWVFFGFIVCCDEIHVAIFSGTVILILQVGPTLNGDPSSACTSVAGGLGGGAKRIENSVATDFPGGREGEKALVHHVCGTGHLQAQWPGRAPGRQQARSAGLFSRALNSQSGTGGLIPTTTYGIYNSQSGAGRLFYLGK
ncbi:hypothetical protein AKJ16_DCAP09431 [Drosera capensis]